MKNNKFILLMTLLSVVLLKATIIAEAQNTNIKANESYKLQPNEKNSSEKAAIATILKDRIEIYDKKNQLGGTPKDVLVQDDRIVFKLKNQDMIIYYSDFIDDPLKYPYYDSKNTRKMVFELLHYDLRESGWAEKNLFQLRELRDHFIVIRNQMIDKYNAYQIADQLALFEPIAKQYRALQVKPSISEEQRKYVVQANSLFEVKQFDKAIDLYKKAININQTSYPAAYSNLALCYAQYKSFDIAIFYMKEYLLLETDPDEARTSQDKIYEWEAMQGK